VTVPTLSIEFDIDSEGPGDAFQAVVSDMQGLLVQVTPADGSPAFDALLVSGREDGDSDLDEVRIHRVDDTDLEPVGEPEYMRVKALRLRS